VSYLGQLKAPSAKFVLIALESIALVVAGVAGWYCLRLDYWFKFLGSPEELGSEFAAQRLGVLVLFSSPLIALLLYTRRIEQFRWRDRRSIALTLTIGLTWAWLGSAASGGAHSDFLDWSELTLSAAGVVGLILVSCGILLHWKLDKAFRRGDARRGENPTKT
jgi:hypothetical protein